MLLRGCRPQNGFSYSADLSPPQNGARTLTSANDYMRVHAAGAFHESGRQRRTSEGHEELGSASTLTTREEIEMPLAKIHVLEGQYDEVRLGRVSSAVQNRSEEHTSELQSQSNLVCRLLLEKKKEGARIAAVVAMFHHNNVTNRRRLHDYPL